MSSSINNRYSPSFGLINTFVLVNSNILLERERERERERRRLRLIYNKPRTNAHSAYFTKKNLSKNNSLRLFLIKNSLNILSPDKVLNKVAVRIPLTAKNVYSFQESIKDNISGIYDQKVNTSNGVYKITILK